MGWKGTLRSIQAEGRRREREAQRRHRELEREAKELARLKELESASHEVDRHETYLEVITGLHRDCASRWNWEGIAQRPEPLEPPAVHVGEERASAALQAYQPSLLDRLLRRVEKKTTSLKGRVERARESDRAETRRRRDAHRDALEEWRNTRDFANRVLAADASALREAVAEAEPFADLLSLGSEVNVEFLTAEVAVATVSVHDYSVIPSKAKSLLKSGKLSVKDMPKGRFFALYQDYVCGSALRVGRELHALLPLRMVIVHATADLLNTATGHMEPAPILSVAVAAETLDRINFAKADPSDALSNFLHRVSFKRTSGFSAISPIAAEELT